MAHTCVLFISVMQLVNIAELFNSACLLFLSTAFAALSAPAPTRVIFPLKSMHHYMYCLTNLLFFDIPLLYCYINLRSSTIFCFTSRDIHIFMGSFLPCSFLTISKLFCCEVFEIFGISSVILLPIKSPVASAVF